MTKNQKRDIATSLTTLIFLVIGITGIFMFFHLFDKYTKELHEILGLAFVVVVIFHVVFNFKSMKQYFSKKVFLLSSIIVAIISLMFIFNAPEGKSSKDIMFNAVFDSNIEKTFVLFEDNIDLAKIKLVDAGLKIEGLSTIKQIAKENKTSPFKILGILSK